ncbi:MAG: hypothetical protein J6N52_11435 [Clostridia bacterium]|nr:hypothetical protein [Clostridia bacterium]
MFRKIYKEANDEINADEQLLEKILQSAQNGKSPKYNFRAVYSAAAAAVIIIGCSVAYPQLIKQPDTDQSSFVEETAKPSPETDPTAGTDEPERSEEAYAADSSETASVSGNADFSQSTAASYAESTAKANKKEAAKTAAPKKQPRAEATAVPEVKPKSAESVQAAATEEAVNYVVQSQPTADEETAPAAAAQPSSELAKVHSFDAGFAGMQDRTAGAENKTEEYPKLKSSARIADTGGTYSNSLASDSGGGGGGGASSYTESADESSVWGIDDYIDYIGFDFRALLAIPDGMEDNSPKQQSAANGEGGGDYGYFLYTDGGGRRVEINVTKAEAESIAAQTEGEKKTFGSNSSYWVGEGTSFTVTFVRNSAGFCVISEGLSEKELTSMLTGLITE